jgi:hypothetical protein
VTYQAYERSANNVIQSVEVYCRHMTDGGTFSATGTPSLTAIERYLDQSYYEIQAALAREGYSVTISGTAALGILEAMQAYGAVAKIELAHPVTGLRGEPNDRYKQFIKLWQSGTAIIATDALVRLGETRSTELGAYVAVGGVSKSRKQGVYDDSDAVQARFKRGMFTNPRAAGKPVDESATYEP